MQGPTTVGSFSSSRFCLKSRREDQGIENNTLASAAIDHLDDHEEPIIAIGKLKVSEPLQSTVLPSVTINLFNLEDPTKFEEVVALLDSGAQRSFDPL